MRTVNKFIFTGLFFVLAVCALHRPKIVLCMQILLLLPHKM